MRIALFVFYPGLMAVCWHWAEIDVIDVNAQTLGDTLSTFRISHIGVDDVAMLYLQRRIAHIASRVFKKHELLLG